jgi:hypothetical protein
MQTFFEFNNLRRISKCATLAPKNLYNYTILYLDTNIQFKALHHPCPLIAKKYLKMFQMVAGEIGQPGPHAVPLVVVELKAELARAATLPLQMVDYLVQDQALKEPHVTLKHAMPQEVSFCKKTK